MSAPGHGVAVTVITVALGQACPMCIPSTTSLPLTTAPQGRYQHHHCLAGKDTDSVARGLLRSHSRGMAEPGHTLGSSNSEATC